MLVIHPDKCIDCGVCEAECPAEATVPDTDPAAKRWRGLNAEYAAKWPNITRKGEVQENADAHKSEPGKYDSYFSAAPGGR